MRNYFSSAALKFLICYLVIGVVWIIISVFLLLKLSVLYSSINIIAFSSIIALLFISITAVSFYLFIRKYEASNKDLFKEINEKNKSLSQNQVKLQEYSLQLEEWKNRYEVVILAADKILYDYNSNSGKIIWGGSMKEILGYQSDSINDSLEWWLEQIHKEDLPGFLQHVKNAHSLLQNFSFEYRVRKKSGEYIYIEDKGYLIHNEIDNNIRVIGLIQDITDIKKHQQLVLINEKRYRHLVENLPAGAVLVEKGKLFFNKATEKITGYTQTEITTIDEWFKCLYKDRHEAIKELYEEDKNNGFKEPRTISIITKYNEVKYLIFAAYLYEDSEVWLVQDVTQQKKIEEKVLSSIILGEDRERKRVAKELHDGLGQYLTAASLHFNAVKKELATLPENQKKQFISGLSFLNEAIDETRNIAQNLMPKAIDDYGLIVALESMINKLMILSPIKISFIHNIYNQELQKNLEINLYRIVQELLNNALKHSRSGKITIQIMKHFDIFILTYEDDGVGFEPDEIEYSNGLGILNIKNRIISMGGSIDIDSIPNKGTNIVLSIPFDKNLIAKKHANQFITS